MTWSRRDFARLLPTLLASLNLRANQQTRLPSNVYVFQDMPVRHSDKLEFRPIVTGKTVEGCKVAVHESKLAPKSEPHPPHHHDGEEIFMMLDGTLEVTINGKSSLISRGSVAFIGSGDEHGIRNPGDLPARYYVIELGPQR
ncbi:MAG TPA: cupin domain-containing protein [Terriglobales bacterium]|nr:cupin domain-containing protein [Terriglobales bacterium]